MFSRTAAILLAILGLYLSAVEAAAAPRGWGGRGGWGGGFRAGGFPGMGWGPRGGGFRGGAFRGGWGAPMGRPYPGGFRGGYLAPYGGRGYGPAGAGGYAPPPPAFAGGEGRAAFDGDWRAQQDEVRRAVREGRHIPLNQAIEAVRRRAPGHELDAGLEAGPDGRPVYRLRWAGQNGRRQDYLVDAGSGAVIGVQGGP